ncbi:PR domain zinc finger protein 10 isoform X1 [Tribolium castaneum]|uniref:PR domain zinc finger protein 10-like Protein n=1 Tax=Tribolium castaneum TaxID=7070 RepID=D6WZU2_TRICA|nr:PREDICTED: PR domain zinc finger protein 10 isoform X1 [Tribolium castaneum]EFA10480.2 PR domain zinc finger protein 10-like Protein [Tribolium castaneum]|eukprot:XP_008198300.1 PREDICTED: PR domain zinc finger protein 10 isoform X1 [Tribolium castaneum]
MDTIVQGPPGEGAQDLNLVDAAWSTQNSQEIVNNNSILYIAVEYIKDEYKMESAVNLPPPENFADFEQHVSPLDPNMSSVARYSPVYSEPTTEYNPVVIHHLVQPNSSQSDINNLAPEPMPVLCNNDIREVVDNHFLQMVNSGNQLQVVPPNEQEVALLITDQETGISYSVRGQEFLVEDEQLLNALSPDPLLDPHLLALDENALKTELGDEIINSTVNTAVNNYITSLSAAVDNDGQYKMETRRQKQNEVEFEDQLLSKVYSIVDKPVPSRARATLPESYLTLSKVDQALGVFAKKTIPRSTQFGPLTGILKPSTERLKNGPTSLQFFIEDENNVVSQIDVSDENASNWMRFIRQATNYNEQNLLITQEGNSLYFTTTRSILPKQELKVGYSVPYATRHKLSILVPEEEKSWPCYECSETFASSDELQKHLNIHDSDEENKWKKKNLKNKKKIPKSETFQCNNCNELFVQPGKVALRQHLIEKHLLSGLDLIDQYFSSVMNYKCDKCELVFNSEPLLKIHNYLHDSDSSDEQTNHVCPNCQKKFPTQRQLVTHVATHALTKKPETETFKCPVCHKMFAMRERLRRHMLVHGSDDSKPLQCKTCNKRFVNNSALAGHIKTHLVGKKIFECPICKENFDHVLKLKLHVPKHCENNTYSCPHCSKVFKKYSIIRKHIRAFHCDQKHACPHCIKMFPTLDKLKMHLLRHSDHREFLCADCGKQFKRKDKLKEHCKRMHSEERENDVPRPPKPVSQPVKKLNPKSEPTDFHRFIYKCHTCLVGFKRRGMLVNHLAKRHPDISPDSVPELNLPILQTTRDYYCQHCDKVYKSSSKRKAHILKNHPGAALPMSNRKQGNFPDNSGLPNPTFSQTVGSITTRPQNCKWCHKQYASKAKLLQHQRKKHSEQLAQQNGGKEEQKYTPPEQAEGQQNDLQDFKVSESDILNSALEEYNKRGGEQFCHFVAIEGGDEFEQSTGDLGAPNSHLFRLLTTSNELPGLVPPR